MQKHLSVKNPVDNVVLNADLFYNDSSTKGLVQIFHGMVETRKYYQKLVDCLLENGYAVLNCDHRGHGESAVVYGHFADEDGWKRNLEDLHSLYLQAKEIIDLPLIVFGHSMGTLVARCYLKYYEKDITKVLLSGMACDNKAIDVGISLVKLIRLVKGKEYRSSLIDSLLFGSFNKQVNGTRTPFEWLSTNEEFVDQYIADPECGYIFTTQGYLDLLLGTKDVYTPGWNVKKPDCAIGFFSGEFDPCMGKEEGMKRAVAFLKKEGYNNVTYRIYPNMRHVILHERNNEQVFTDILAFLEAE